MTNKHSDTDPRASLDELAASLPDGRLMTNPDEVAAFTGDASQVGDPGTPLAVVEARSTEDVAQAARWGNEHRVPVSVRAAGSGVSGGALAYEGGLVISVAELNQILEIDPAGRVARVQAGVITADLDAAAREHGLFYAPDPASAGFSTIGGNIATNAGGLRCLAYGDTGRAVAALTVVLANGDVIKVGARTIKNTTGLNLAQLFVGSEGTLGIITEATVWLTPVVEGAQYSFMASFDSIEDAGRAVVDIVSSAAFLESLELIDAPVVRWIRGLGPEQGGGEVTRSLPTPQAALLIGHSVGPQALQSIELAAQLADGAGAADVRTGDSPDLLEARRLALPALKAHGEWVMGDVGVPLSKLPAMIQRIAQIESEESVPVRIVGHAGDGNLHPMVQVTDKGQAASEKTMDRIVAAAVEFGGVISGEHGIGSLKHHELPVQFDEATLRAQRAVKQALDPNEILSPGRAI